MSGSVASSSLPESRWWAVLGLLLAIVFTLGWPAAAVTLLGIFIFMARPLDFLVTFLVVVAGASFVTLGGGPAGALTIQLGFLTIGILGMLGLYVLSYRDRMFSIPLTSLTLPLLAYIFLSLINAIRGVLAGAELRFIGLELIATLALGTSFLIGNVFRPQRDMRLVIGALIVIAFAQAIRGFSIASVMTHSVTVYSMTVPGIVGVLLFNLALRSKKWPAVLGFVALSLPLFLHQFITFGRGLWTGCIAGVLLSALIFAGFGRGMGQRWKRAGQVFAMLVVLGGIGGAQAAILLGHADLLQQAGVRLASITSTEESYETRSTFARLWEYSIVANHLRKNPWLGYGLGFSFSVRLPWSRTSASGVDQSATQWIVHQNYLLVWLKQGVIGLAVFLWMIWTAIWLGIREARRRTDMLESSLCATMAGGTAFLAVFSLSNFPFAEVSGTFLMALLWGTTMTYARSGLLRFQWSADHEETPRALA